MSSFIDSGVGLALSIWFVIAVAAQTFYNCEANDLGVVWCSYNKWTNRLRVYRRLLTNRLQGKAAELCLVNS